MTRGQGAHATSTLHTPSEDRWRDQAACRGADTELFYPTEADDVTTAKAVAHCQVCPVADACLTDALATGDRYGIRGGLTERQRRALHSHRPQTSERLAV